MVLSCICLVSIEILVGLEHLVGVEQHDGVEHLVVVEQHDGVERRGDVAWGQSVFGPESHRTGGKSFLLILAN